MLASKPLSFHRDDPAGPALAAFACSLELVTYSRTSTKGIAAARALSQTVCVGTLLCVGISGSFVGALGARVPGDGPAKPDIDQPLDDSQNREEWQVEFVATGGPGVSLEGDSSSTGESRGPDSRPQIPAATSGAESGSGPAGGTRSGLGLARKITVPGRGDLPYGQLAMEGFRRRAQQLREQWEDEDRYLKQTVGRAIVSQSGLPTQQQVQHWKASASYRYQRRYRIRMREAATLESMAEEISVKLKAAGVDIPSSDGHPSPPSRTRDQASSTGSDAIPPGTASGSGGSGITIRSYVQIGVSMLRKEAREIDSLWANKDEFVGEHVAARIARSINQYPTDSLVDQWILDAKRMHTQRKVLHEEKSASLRALAEEWEKRLISGALIQEDSGETGRHHKRQRKPSSGGLATISVSSAPSVSSASQAAQSEGSLRGTVLGSCVELPGMGSVPYVKLAIQKLRREAHNLIFRWQSIETYIRLRIVENMLEKKNRNPSPAQVWHWIALARQSYSRFGPLRTQEAADLNSVADDLETRASAAGLLVRSPQEAPVHGSELVRGQPAPASEGVSCGAEVTFAHLAIEHLRRQAEELDATWGSAEEHFVATRIAYRIARANAPPPHPGKQQEWAFQDRTTFRAARAVHQRKAQHIRNQADALEQELRDLLSSTPSRAAEPARESASTAGQSSELPSGKRRQKRKHLSPSGSGSFGEGPSRGGATLPPLSLWLTPVSTFRLWRRQRRLRTAQVTSGPGSASPASLQLHPTEAASEKASGHSLSAPDPATRSTGVPLPPAALALSTTTPLHPAGSGSSAGVPAAPQPKKRRLLDFVSAQAAAHQLAPQMHTPPPGQISGTSTQIPSEHLPLGPREASGPSLTSFLSTGHATPFGPVSEIIPPRCLPLKKRPLREPAATIQSPTADVATSGPRRVSSDSLTVSSTSSGSHSQAPASTDSPAPTSAPHGVRGVGLRIRRGAPEPR